MIIVTLLEELICRYIGVQDDESKYVRNQWRYETVMIVFCYMRY